MAPIAPQKPPPSVRPSWSPIRLSVSRPPISDRDDDRNRGDGHVVVELADRLHERPAIGAEHQHAVGRVDQRHAGGEQRREHHDRSRTTCRWPPARTEMPNSATSVAVSKPRPNRNPIGNMCQLLVTSRNSGRKIRDEEPALVEQDVEILLRERLAALDRLKGAVDRDQHQNVDEGDREQERAPRRSC